MTAAKKPRDLGAEIAFLTRALKAPALRRHRVGVLRPVGEPEVEQRSLAAYDALLGTGDGGAA